MQFSAGESSGSDDDGVKDFHSVHSQEKTPRKAVRDERRAKAKHDPDDDSPPRVRTSSHGKSSNLSRKSSSSSSKEPILTVSDDSESTWGTSEDSSTESKRHRSRRGKAYDSPVNTPIKHKQPEIKRRHSPPPADSPVSDWDEPDDARHPQTPSKGKHTYSSYLSTPKQEPRGTSRNAAAAHRDEDMDELYVALALCNDRQ